MMANAMNINHPYRTNQLIKVEKENENLELKKRMKNVCKGKNNQHNNLPDGTMRRENVWDRLSKHRKTPSSENVSINRSRQNLPTKPSHRFQIMKQMAAQHQQQQQQHQMLYHQQQQQQEENIQHSPRRPLTPHSGSNSRRGTQKYHMQKAIIMPEIDNQGFVYVCKPLKSVREILTARSLNQSKSSSEDYKNADSQACEEVTPSQSPSMTVIANDNMTDDSSEDSSGDFKLAPLMSSRSHYDLMNTSSAKIIHKFHEVLQRRGQSFLEPEESKLVKNVIKSDKRYHHLDKSDPKLFKEILKSQLQDILKHEYAVKQALQKLESSDSLQASRKLRKKQPITEIMTYSQHSGEPQKLEVDVVFKNVPSLEKEIIILRALGEKLDATLKRSSSQRSLHLKSQETALHTKSSPKDKIFMLIEIKCCSFIYAIEFHATSSVRSKGLRLTSGVAQEFRIAQKTIVELKEDANRSFYIPINPETAELKITSFKKLKQNPDILMRHLKAKNAVRFNVLDHDPVFFNNIFFSKNQKNRNLPLDNVSTEDEPTKKEQSTLCEGGDSCQFNEVKLKHEKSHSKQIRAESKVRIKKSLKLMEPCVRGAKDRRRIRCCSTPIPLSKDVSPKNNLFKTILVGSVQLSCFMLLIVAFTFPEVKC